MFEPYKALPKFSLVQCELSRKQDQCDKQSTLIFLLQALIKQFFTFFISEQEWIA